MSALRSVLALTVALLAVLAPSGAGAQDVPRIMTFQGRLVRTDGTPENTPQDLSFALYESPTGGGALWLETHFEVPVTNGYYSVPLGSKSSLGVPLLRRGRLYLGVAIAGQSELTPRVELGASPFALRAADSQLLDGRAASTFADSGHGHPDATTSSPGFLSAADKAKLDAPATAFGDGLSVSTSTPPTVSVSFPNPGGTNGTSTSAARANHSHATATPSAAGFMSNADKTKLDTLAAPADGLTVSGTPARLRVSFAATSATSGAATTVARSDHSHGLVCVHRTATGGDDADPRVSVSWCAANEVLTGGGCSGLDLPAGVAFHPTGPATESGTVNTGGPGYRCRSSNAAATPPTAYAICCRLP